MSANMHEENHKDLVTDTNLLADVVNERNHSLAGNDCSISSTLQNPAMNEARKAQRVHACVIEAKNKLQRMVVCGVVQSKKQRALLFAALRRVGVPS